MKKKLIILFVLIFGTIGVVSAKPNDTKVRVDYLQNVYGNFIIGDLFYWNQIGLTYANNKLAYCLEPGKWITESIYDSYTDFSYKNLSKKDKEYLELVAYYGYQFKGHQTTKYYLATQELIWRYLGLKEIYWTTKAEHQGEKINVENEKNEIKRLMNSHTNKPSFHGNTYQAILGVPFTLDDKNKVLHDYGIILPIHPKSEIKNNQLLVYPEKVGNYTLSFLRYPHAYQASFLYTKNDSQALGTFGLSSRVEANIHINVKGYQLTLHKKDSNTNSNIPSGEGSLKGAIYEISGDNGYFNTLKTDENGIAILKNIPSGKYQIKEIKPSKGYQLDKKIYHLTLDKDTDLEVEMDVLEEIIENKIKLVKVFSNGDTGIVKPEVAIRFGIYQKDGTLYQEVVTNSYGTVEFKLPYGNYTVKQLNTLPNYEKVKDFEIQVVEDKDEVVQYVLHDKYIKSKLKIRKVDERGNQIKEAGITFKIKNLDKDEYVKQEITYPNHTTIEKFQTNENGEIILPESLPAGNYALEEIKAPTGYYLKKEPIAFTLNENTEYEETKDGLLYTIQVKNDRQKGKVKINKTGKKVILEKDEDGIYQEKEVTELLTGVQFELYANEEIEENGKVVYRDKEQVQILETKDGKIMSQELPLGSYCVKEVKTVGDYLLDKEPHCFHLEAIENITEIQIKEFSFVNETPHTKIEVIKEKEIMERIQNQQGIYKLESFSDIEFAIYNQEPMIMNGTRIEKNTLLMRKKTDLNGKLSFENLPFGRYVIRELTEKEDYKKISDKEVELNHLQQKLSIKIKNEKKKGSIMVVKQDSDGNLLKGAEFSLYNKDGGELYREVVDEKGILLFEKLEFGTYYLEEVKAPLGYQKEQQKIKIEIKQDNIVEKIVVKNNKIILPNTSSLTRKIQCLITISFSAMAIFFFTGYFIKNRKHG